MLNQWMATFMHLCTQKYIILYQVAQGRGGQPPYLAIYEYDYYIVNLTLKGAHPRDLGQLDFSSKGLLAPVEQKIS